MFRTHIYGHLIYDKNETTRSEERMAITINNVGKTRQPQGGKLC